MRVAVSDELLAELVEERLEALFAAGAAFTAYDVTRALRMEQPHLEIRHEAVRAWVHSYMAYTLVAGLYVASCRRFPGGVAILYEPAPAPAFAILTALPSSHAHLN